MATSHTQQLEILNEVARIATRDLRLRPMLQRITDALAHKFDWEFVALVLIDHEREAFVCEAVTSSAPTEIVAGYSRPLGSGVVGEVATTRKPIVIDDVRTVENYVETMPGTRSELCVPVLHGEQLVAVLNLESQRVAAFHDELPLLTTVAEQIAGAIASAQLHEELQRRARLMQMMSEVSRTALQATDLDELLQRIVTYIEERFEVRRVAIVPCEEGKLDSGAALPPGSLATLGMTGERDTVTIPIRFGHDLLGFLEVQARSAEVLNAATVLALEAFADQVAGAINLAKVNNELALTSAQLVQKTRALEDANEHLAKAIETLHRISTLDGLTGVSNRRHFDETLTLEWRRGARTQAPLSLLMIDIDYFKAFNDANGHQLGDECLRRVAHALRECLQRAGDLVARYGGEEFVVLLPDTDAVHARSIAESVRAKVESLAVEHAASPFGRLTISAGCATMLATRDVEEAQELVRGADRALYVAKREGRNRVEVY